MGHFSQLNYMTDGTFRFFLVTCLYSYREIWHLASYFDKYPNGIHADIRSLIIFVLEFISNSSAEGGSVPHAKTSGKLINTTFLIGGNFQAKKGSLTAASVPRHCPLYRITSCLTISTLLE